MSPKIYALAFSLILVSQPAVASSDRFETWKCQTLEKLSVADKGLLSKSGFFKERENLALNFAGIEFVVTIEKTKDVVFEKAHLTIVVQRPWIAYDRRFEGNSLKLVSKLENGNGYIIDIKKYVKGDDKPFIGMELGYGYVISGLCKKLR